MNNNKGSGWALQSWALNDDAGQLVDKEENSFQKQDETTSAQGEVNKNIINAEQHNNFSNEQMIGEMSNLFGAEDRKLLNAMASMQMKYGQASEAIAILLLCRLSDNGDLQTLRLLIRAYIRMEWWDKAAEMNKEYKYFSKKESKTGHLLNALILLGQTKLGEAREQFKMFVKNKIRPNN